MSCSSELEVCRLIKESRSPWSTPGEGKDHSPGLQWEAAPPGTKELALICEDPDAPRPDAWVHWLVYKIPASVTKLPEGIRDKERLALPPSAFQGRNSFGKIGYGGPLPRKGMAGIATTSSYMLWISHWNCAPALPRKN